MSAGWDQAKSAALAVLGSKAKIPEPKQSYIKIREEHEKLHKDFQSAVTVLQAKILALQNSSSANRNTVKQYMEIVAKSNFGVEDADKAKLDKAHDIMNKYITTALANWDKEVKNLDELDRHTMAINSYTPQP